MGSIHVKINNFVISLNVGQFQGFFKLLKYEKIIMRRATHS